MASSVPRLGESPPAPPCTSRVLANESFDDRSLRCSAELLEQVLSPRLLDVVCKDSTRRAAYKLPPGTDSLSE